jgi:hypothetical protein
MYGDIMQVNFNKQNNHSVGFSSLKQVKGDKELRRLIGNEGFIIVDRMAANLEANQSFQTLCNNFDVFVSIKPKVLGQTGRFKNNGLSLEILAKKPGISGMFSKKEPVTEYVASGVEAKVWKLADTITECFIRQKKGMEAKINEFLINTAEK